jgi:tetratricopeptide (TPR) repeat protein
MIGLAQIADGMRTTLLEAAPDALDPWIARAPDWALLVGAAFLALAAFGVLAWASYAAWRAMAWPRLAYAPKQRQVRAPQQATQSAPPRPHWSGLAARMQARLEELAASTSAPRPPTPAQLKELKDDEQKLLAGAAEAAPTDLLRELGALRAMLDPGKAIEAFEGARALDSTDFWTHAFLARLYERAGRPDEAQQAGVAAVRAAATAWQLMEFEDQVLSADETLEQLEAAKRSLPNVGETLEAMVKSASREEVREFGQLLGLLISLGARFVDRDPRTGAAALEWSACLAAGLVQAESRAEIAQLAADKYLRERLAHLNSFADLAPLAATLLERLDALAGEGAPSTTSPA